MDRYYVTKEIQSGGAHEVHSGSCPHLPNTGRCEHLGLFLNCDQALEAARKIYPDAIACRICCSESKKN